MSTPVTLRLRVSLAVSLLAVPRAWAQAPLASSAESRAVRAFAAAAGDPLTLRTLLVRMPKGGELHMHLSGAVYAETFIEDARADLLCIDPMTHSLVTNVGTTRSIPPQPVCGEHRLRSDEAFKDQRLYDSLVDAFSMRSFVPSAGVSAHDQFFATFDRFDPTHSAGARHGGEWLDEVASRAAAQNEQYLEIMHTPDLGPAIRLGATVAWPNSPTSMAEYHQDVAGTSDAELGAARKTMMASAEWESDIAADRAEFRAMLDQRQAIEHCGQAGASPACGIEIRFLFQVLRANEPAMVFAQTLLAFEIAERERQAAGAGAVVVGLNFVQPEDSRLAMAEYTRQMHMIGYLHSVYPQVHISLHAGEVAPGLVAPEGTRFHIRQAINIAHAERIGHGVDVMNEDEAPALLQEMAARHILAEINVTSNDVILGVAGAYHPLPHYRAAHVPVALSTDDEGVSRIDLTHEYVRAAIDFHLSYLDLKTMARAAIEHSFIPGASLWREPDAFGRPVAVCGGQPMGGDHTSSACTAFLGASRRATQQWELEHRFRVFESSLP